MSTQFTFAIIVNILILKYVGYFCKWQKNTESDWIIARNESEAMSKAVKILGTSAENIELNQGTLLN